MAYRWRETAEDEKQSRKEKWQDSLKVRERGREGLSMTGPFRFSNWMEDGTNQ